MRRAFLAVLLGLSMVASACGGNDDDSIGGRDTTETSGAEEGGGEPQAGGTLTVGIVDDGASLLPSTGQFTDADWNVAYAVFDPLVRRDADGELRPYLAESIEPNEDYSVWTLTLRPDVTFHDGTALDAQAIKNIFDEFLSVETSGVARDAASIDSLDVVDDLTVTYTLVEGSAAFPDKLTSYLGLPFSPTAAREAGADAGVSPKGTGPFVLDEWSFDSQFVVSKNPDYWQDGLPYLDGITFTVIPDEESRNLALEGGDIDALQSLRQLGFDPEGEDFVVHTHAGNNTSGTIFNVTKPPLDDVRVRTALAQAYDPEDILTVLKSPPPRRTQLFSEDSPWYSEAVTEAYPEFDSEAATALIEEYKNDPERSDGKDTGDPVSFSYLCLPDPGLIEYAQVYQAAWSNIGVEVQLEQIERGALGGRVVAGDYEALCTRIGDERDPYTVLAENFTAESPANRTKFSDPGIDAALDRLRATDDVEERKAAVEEVGLILTEAMVIPVDAGTPLYIVTEPGVNGIGDWTFPDGTPGEGMKLARVMWGFIWHE